MPEYYAYDPFLAVHQALRANWLDLPMAVLSTACEGWMLALIGLAWFSWCESTVKGVLLVWWPALVALVVDGVVVELLKNLFETPRPLAVYGPVDVRVILEPLLRNGFPSGHSSAAATLAMFGVLAFGWRGAGLVALAFLGGISRVYVGAHWVFDVLGGWVVGMLIATATYWALRRLPGGGHLQELRDERLRALRRR